MASLFPVEITNSTTKVTLKTYVQGESEKDAINAVKEFDPNADVRTIKDKSPLDLNRINEIIKKTS